MFIYFNLVLDTFGKPPSGILEGSFKWPGEYSECLKIEHQFNNSNLKWQSNYCTIPAEIKIQEFQYV